MQFELPLLNKRKMTGVVYANIKVSMCEKVRMSAGWIKIAGMLLVAGIIAGCATSKTVAPSRVVGPVAANTAQLLKNKWGIEITSLRMSGHGHLIDLRYRVLDPDKAVLMGDRNVKPTLTDLATGTVLRVPSFPKTGSMRQTADRLEAGRIYFMLFANAGVLVKSGSRVTVTVGDFKAENLVVQ